jgi:hypothetical protein
VYPALIPWRSEDIDCGDDAMTLPTFVVIGAMKAGTVSLRHYLDEHPDVFIGGGGMFGEPNFFVAEDNWPRGPRLVRVFLRWRRPGCCDRRVLSVLYVGPRLP